MTNSASGSGRDKCGGRTRSDGLCGRPAGWGTSHPGVGSCKLHGGSTPNHQIHAARVLTEQAEASALAELHRLGVPPVADPLTALGELAAEARQWQAILRRQVAELESLSQMTPAGVEQVRAVVTLFERAMDRTAAFAAMMAKLNVDERIFKLHERISRAHAEQAAVAVERVLVRLGHADPRHDPVVAPIVAAEFRALAADDD